MEESVLKLVVVKKDEWCPSGWWRRRTNTILNNQDGARLKITQFPCIQHISWWLNCPNHASVPYEVEVLRIATNVWTIQSLPLPAYLLLCEWVETTWLSLTSVPSQKNQLRENGKTDNYLTLWHTEQDAGNHSLAQKMESAWGNI